MNELAIITQLNSNRFKRRLPDSLSLAQFYVLNNFVRLGGTRTPAQLASAFQVTRGAMTNTLKKLEARGCLTLTPDAADGRSKIVAVTQVGRDLQIRAVQATAQDQEKMSEALDLVTIRKMLPHIRQIRTYLDEHRD